MEVSGLCEMMGGWPHVGGLFDQDPYWIDLIRQVVLVRSEKQKKDAEEQKREMKRAEGRRARGK